MIHDIGEMAMNREYIRATVGMASNEQIDLHRHPVIGEQEAAKLDLPRGVQLIVRWHHEGCGGYRAPGLPWGREDVSEKGAARLVG